MYAPLDYMLIGHVAHDETPNGPRLGGTVSYSGMTVHALGGQVGIVTSARANEVVLRSLPYGIHLHVKTAPTSTVFVNTYVAEKRRQVLKSRALTLTLDDVPSAWRDTPIVHLGPLDDEVDPDLAFAFPNAIVGATPQGWLRAWDAEGVIRPKPWEYAERLLPQLDATVFSEEDIQWNTELEAYYASLAKLLIITRAAKGCTIYQQGHHLVDIAAPHVQVVDATGAGDIFTGVFLSMLYRTNDIGRAAEIATQVASASVTRIGPDSVPTPEEVHALLDNEE